MVVLCRSQNAVKKKVKWNILRKKPSSKQTHEILNRIHSFFFLFSSSSKVGSLEGRKEMMGFFFLSDRTVDGRKNDPTLFPSYLSLLRSENRLASVLLYCSFYAINISFLNLTSYNTFRFNLTSYNTFRFNLTFIYF